MPVPLSLHQWHSAGTTLKGIPTDRRLARLPTCPGPPAGAILRFVEEHTENVEGVGDVCSLAAFDFGRHGNAKYGAPAEAPKVWGFGIGVDWRWGALGVGFGGQWGKGMPVCAGLAWQLEPIAPWQT